MNRRQERHYRRTARNNARQWLDDAYTLGGRFLSDPPHGDCRGLYDSAWELAGALAAIGGRHINVRALWAEGNKSGKLLPPDAPVKVGDAIIYYEPKGKPTPANPKCIRHVTFVEFPDSPAHPGGVAIGATNPTLGVVRSDLALTKVWRWPDDAPKPVRFGLAVLNIYRPNLAALDATDTPAGDPEPPVGDVTP
jgi:hypothetical protein